MHDRAQCPSCPHLAHIVREYSFRFEKRLGAPVFWERRCWPEGGGPDVLFLSVIAFGPGLFAPVLGGCGVRKPRPRAFVWRNFRT